MEVKLNEGEVKRSLEATCPECRGPLSESDYGGFRDYSCLVGHRYSARALLQAHSEAQEKSLWAAVVALEEAGNLVREVANAFPADVAKRLQEQASEKMQQAGEIRRILARLEPFQTQGAPQVRHD